MWKAMNVFIDQMRRLYNDWDIRVMVLLSLLFQVLLQLLGNRRKFSRSVWLRIIVWCCYVSVDSIAIMALGTISNKIGRVDDLSHLDGETKLNALWAPCLLLLLGGPDSITAYSVEDNQMWLRHFAVLVAQTLVAGYVCFMSWVADCLSYLSLLLLVAGVIKYGERVWVLWQVSFDKLRNAQYLRFDQIELNTNEYPKVDESVVDMDGYNEPTQGYILFQMFKRVFLSQKLYTMDKDISRNLFRDLSPQRAFKIIEIELGFMYDLLHTKTKSTYTWWGLCRRLMTSTISCIVLAVFSWFVNTNLNYPTIDVVVTLVLLATYIFSEIYWVFMLLASDWAQVFWFRRNEESRCSKNCKFVVPNTLLQLCKQPQWANSVSQLSFFSGLFLTSDGRPTLDYQEQLLKKLHLHEKLGPHYYTHYRDITDCIKDQIFMIRSIRQTQVLRSHKELLQCVYKGNIRSSRYNKLLERYDLEDIIIIWHIATELCNYYDVTTDDTPPRSRSDIKDIMKARNAAMLLSRYMFYILVRYPLMVQTVDVNIKLKDVKRVCRSFFLLNHIIVSGDLTKSDAKKLMIKGDDTNPIMYKKFAGAVNTDDKPPLFNTACRFAKELMTIDDEVCRFNVWEFMLKSWITHLYYGAYNCKEEYHTQQLRRGGELFTHVWMLMVHLGLTDHFTEHIRGLSENVPSIGI